MSTKKIRFQFAKVAEWPPQLAPTTMRRSHPRPILRDLWPFLVFAFLLGAMALMIVSR